MFFFSECNRCLVPGPLSILLKVAILLCIPAMFGGMVLVARMMGWGKARNRAVMAVPFVSVVLFLFVPLILTSDLPGRHSPLVLHEGPFDWPQGCAHGKYNRGDQISIACHDYRNALARKVVLDHGFRWSLAREDPDYFRVGADAVNFQCNYYRESCVVSDVERNVFQ